MAAPIPDFSKVALLLPMNGANGGTAFTDYSPATKTVTRTGAVTSTAQSKYYGSSGYFDGTGDRLSIASHADFALGTGDFTIGFWFRKTPGDAEPYQRLVQIGSDNTNGNLLIHANTTVGDDCKPFVSGYSGASVTAVEPGASVTQGEWHHLELDRYGADWFLWIDGALYAQGNWAAYNAAQNPVYVCSNNTGVREFAGYLQDLYVVKGQALHTTAFAPPARLIGQIAVETRDESGVLVPRKVFAVPRSYPSKVVASGTTDSNGALTVTGLVACEHTIVALAEGDALPDLVLRRLPT